MELKEISRKIESVNNIWKLTSALETLSALKMKKSQKVALSSRPFSEKIAEILRKLDSILAGKDSVFFEKREGNNVLALVLSSDRGFCGSFNQNILRFSEKEIKLISSAQKVDLLAVGKKAAAYFKKRSYDVKYNFFGIGDFAELADIKMLSDFLVKKFLENQYQEVYLFYTHFLSTFSQKPRKLKLLPVDKENLDIFLKAAPAGEERTDFLIEPSPDLLLEEVVPQLIEYLVYQAILEGNASEHSSRMIAMKNASENAKKKNDDLKLDYNKARQEDITSEVLEVSSAKESLE